MKSSVSLAKLEQALAKGDVNQALAVIALDKKFVSILHGEAGESGIISFRGAVEAVFAAGAKAASEQLPKIIAAELSFNVKAPEAISFLEKYEFDLIKQVTADTTAAIRQTIVRAFEEGGHPYEQARQIKQVIGLTSQQEQAVANYRNALSDTSTMRGALDRALRDGRYDATVLRNIKNGTNLSQAQIDKMVERYEERFVQYRAQTIARTESIRASSKGRTELWRQAREQGLLGDNAMREWEVSGDERTCEECMDLDGEQAGLDEEFEPGIFEPPDPHPDCRCSVKLVFGK
jgi:SPP1 gp7 family putative phage head morphogenesis protein